MTLRSFVTSRVSVRLVILVSFALVGMQTLTTSVTTAQNLRSDDLRADALRSDSIKTFRLGKVEITGAPTSGSERGAEALVERLTQRTITSLNRMDVGTALNLVPGLALSAVGPRNETGVYVRGFDLRQVPVYLDGVPVYVPYDGYVDLARFTTFDLAEMNVAKGFSSVLYGANALGGAINLVSRRPVRPLEAEARLGWMTGGYVASVNAGGIYATPLGDFYLQSGASLLNRQFSVLPQNFTATRYEDGGQRENSFRRDWKLSLKIGFTPANALLGDEYAVSVQLQRGTKGNPTYLGSDANIQARFWQWPYWNKESAYWLSQTTLGDRTNAWGYVKTRIYYDRFTNLLRSFDDATFTTQARPFAFDSYYDDDTFGGTVELGTTLIERNTLKIAAHYKYDTHRENNAGEPVRTFRDGTFSVGVEDVWTVMDALSVVAGVNFNARTSFQAQGFRAPRDVYDFPLASNTSLDPQLAALYRWDGVGLLHASIARKSRFPTIKDRYSFRLGQALANPDLQQENALHYELGWSGAVTDWLRGKLNLLSSDITNVIQRVDNVTRDPQTNRPLFQLQNVGNARHLGVETAWELSLANTFSANVQYTYLNRRNVTTPEIRLIDTPEHRFLTTLQYTFVETITIGGSIEYNSARFSTVQGSVAGEFTLVNVRASWNTPVQGLVLDAGVNNLLDRLYYLVEGFPEEGRNFFINLSYRL